MAIGQKLLATTMAVAAAFGLAALAPVAAQAAEPAAATGRLAVEDDSSNVLVLSGANQRGAQCDNSSCAQFLQQGWQQWVDLTSADSWATLSYDVCTSVDWSTGKAGCAGYQGHVDVRFTAGGVEVAGAQGGTASLTDKGNGVAGLTFSSNLLPSWPAHPSAYADLPFRGVNLAGAEYDYADQLPTEQDGAYYAAAGMNTIRLPFLWEYLQSTSSNPQDRANDPAAPIDWTNPNAKAYADLVDKYLSHGLTVIIDMHNYMRYGQDKAIIGSGAGGAPTADQYAQAWRQIAARWRGNDHVVFDLMNEPNQMSQTVLLKDYNTAISAIRAAGADNLVLLEGNGWSGAHSWDDPNVDTDSTKRSNAVAFAKGNIQDPAHHNVINVHQYFDANASGTGQCVPNDVPNIDGLKTFLTTNGMQAIVTELGGPNTADCATDINNFIQQLYSPHHDGSGPFIGFTGWAGGERGRGLFTYFGPNADMSGSTVTMTDGFGKHLAPAS